MHFQDWRIRFLLVHPDIGSCVHRWLHVPARFQVCMGIGFPVSLAGSVQLIVGQMVAMEQRFIHNDFIGPPVFFVVSHINVQKISYSGVFLIFLVGPFPKSSPRMSSGRTIDFSLFDHKCFVVSEIAPKISPHNRQLQILFEKLPVLMFY